MSASPAPPSRPSSTGPHASTNKYASTPLDKQRTQLEKLLKDPNKEAYIPPPPKDKTIRPAREMMKNVQGSSAGAGSGEFHVYKASRRREYERLKLMDEATQKEAEIAEFERKRIEREAIAEAKTAKNRSKRQKKKERAKAKGGSSNQDSSKPSGASNDDAPLKKRRLVNGTEIIFRKPEEDSDDDTDEDGNGIRRAVPTVSAPHSAHEELSVSDATKTAEESRVVIHEDE